MRDVSRSQLLILVALCLALAPVMFATGIAMTYQPTNRAPLATATASPLRSVICQDGYATRGDTLPCVAQNNEPRVYRPMGCADPYVLAIYNALDGAYYEACILPSYAQMTHLCLMPSIDAGYSVDADLGISCVNMGRLITARDLAASFFAGECTPGSRVSCFVGVQA